jgi:phage-related minor tail protein
MAEIGTDLSSLDAQIGDLEATIGSAQTVSAAFKGELMAMQATMSATGQQVDGLSRSVGYGLRRAFDGLVFDGLRLSDALKQLGSTMINAALNQALKPVQNALGGFLVNGMQSLVSGLLPFKDGASFSGGQVTPFARGGVVSKATSFPMRGGIGLMGEAGPEAIMPLSRGADGSLGVRAPSGRSVHVTMNISTPNAEGFRRSRSQIAAQMSRAISRGARNN